MRVTFALGAVMMLGAAMFLFGGMWSGAMEAPPRSAERLRWIGPALLCIAVGLASFVGGLGS
jgi:hypothetical protein